MKTGIISINAHTKNLNFACPLHSYAFQQFLLQNGIECVILDYRPNYDHGFDARNPYKTYQKNCRRRRAELSKASDEATRTALKKRLERDEMFRDGCKALGNRRKIRYDKFQHFIDRYYIKTEECYDTALLEVEDPGFDCYICATDVIWKHSNPEGFDRGFFLASRAMENKWKIAYAASRGVSQEYTESEKREFFHCLEDFDFLSVREESLKQYIEENSDLQVQTVLDPVLLHDAAFYEKILIPPPEEHYVLLYYVMEKATGTIEAAAAYAREHGMKIVEITDLPLADGRLAEYPGLERIYRYEIGVEEWLGYLRYADYVFTNSFHATCLSILFQREFQTGFRMGDKLSHLLEQFGLTKRKIRKGKEPGRIDYEKVTLLLKQQRDASAQYILGAIAAVEHQKRAPRDYDAWKKGLSYRLTYRVGTSGQAEQNPGEGIRTKVITNDGNCRLPERDQGLRGGASPGWLLRVRIVDRWFYCRKDGELIRSEDFVKENCRVSGRCLEKGAEAARREYLWGRIVRESLLRKKRNAVFEEYLFAPGETIPYIPVGQIDLMVADGPPL